MKNLKILFNLLLFSFFFLINKWKTISIYSKFTLATRKILLILVSLFISTSIYAVELVNEQFTSNIDGWTVSDSSKVYYSSDYSGSMFLDRREWGEKTYHFGSSYANQTLDVELRWCATTQWENNNDFLRVKVNGDTVEEDYDGGGCQTITFTADANSNGDFKIRFVPRSSSNDEDANIDWFKVNGTPVSTGCDNSLDTSANDTYPGVAIPNLDGASGDASNCISGSSRSDDEEYYHFTVNSDGRLDITTSSPNGHDNHFEVESSIHGTLHGYDTDRDRSLSYDLVADERIVILFKETGDDTDWWQADLNFTATIVAQVPPVMNPIPAQSPIKDDFYSLDLSTYVTLTNGDPIITDGYTLTGAIPPGLTFNTNTGVLSGTPTTTASAVTLSVTAEDNDGESNSESFSIEISDTPLTCSNYDSNNNDCGSVAIISSMDQITDSKHRCIYGSSTDGASDSSDYYKFTVQTFGTLTVTGERTDGKTSEYHLEVGPSCGSSDWYNGYAADHTSPSIDLKPGDTVYIYVKESGSDTDEYEVDFNFIADHSFKTRDDIYYTALNQSKKLYVLTNDYPGENETFQKNSINITSAAADGTATVNTDGTITYIPDTGYIGVDTFKYTIKNSAGDISNEATVTISVGITLIHRGETDFILRNPAYTRNIRGNMEVIGNTLQCITTSDSSYGSCETTNRSAHNNGRYTNYIDIDSDSTTFNSSSATLNLPVGSKIIWAGLYWQSYIHNSTYGNEDYADNIKISNEAHLGEGDGDGDDDTENGLILDEGNSWGVENILWKKPNDTNYHGLKAERIDFDYLGYAGFIDVTQEINATNPNGTYVIANVKGNRGRERSHGNFGGWNIIFIYTHPDEEVRNVSVYNGYSTVNTSHPIDITIEGFRTPSEGDLDSKLSFFSMEGEYGSGGDYLEVNGQKIIDQEGSDEDIFDGSITGSPTRNPKLYNNDGLDLDTFDVSDKMTHDQRSATIKSATGGDRYTPSMFAFNTQLYVPDVCYDYVVRKNNFTLDANGRNIVTSGNGELSIGVSIRSREGDIDLETAKLKVRIIPSDKATFTKALYSPDTMNILIPAIRTNTSSTEPEIAIGSNPNDLGGTIGARERYFTKFYYDLDKGAINGRFEFDLNTSIDFGSGPVNYVLSSGNGTIDQCEQSNVYNPVWGMFNIERTNSGDYDPLTQRNERFPLYTQIVGRDFDLSVVAYDKNASVPFSKELEVSDVTVEIELIDVTSFDTNGSFFKCSNTDPTVIQTLSDGKKSFFATFPSTPQARIDIDETDDMVTDTALRNAAFRMWILVDENNTVIRHQCSKNDDQCFKDNVYPYINTTNTPCTTAACSQYVSEERGGGGCYDCLRDYFAQPICSRDNFSIRPESYRLRLNDHNESVNITDPKINLAINDSDTNNKATLAAEYIYLLDGNATVFNSEAAAKNYNIDANTTLSFDPATGTTCTDTDDRNLSMRFENGAIVTIPFDTPEISNPNVGNYFLRMMESTWTKVDQKTYEHKAFNSDDCILNDGTISGDGDSLSGCNTVSNLDEDHKDIKLTFRPYSFDVSSLAINLPNSNDFLYTNQIDTSDILQLYMSVYFDGNVTATGKHGTKLSNYIDGCAALPVSFDINRTVSRDGNEIDENNIESIDLHSTIPVREKISLQRRYLNQESSPDYSVENNQSGTSTIITITANQFKQENNGSARIRLYYNLERQEEKVMDPVTITLLSKEANSTAAMSSTHLKPDYVPSGTSNINKALNFYYGRVVGGQEAPYVVPRSETNTIIPMYVEAYCNNLNIDCTKHNLTQESLRDSNIWWINEQHVSGAGSGDGNMIKLKDVQASSPLTITPNTDVFLNLNGNRTDISVSINPSVLRPYNTTIDVKTDVWLGYNPDNIFNPIVHFLGGGGWAGKGNTGKVVGTDPYFDENNKRIEW
jgi:hypothetical protein